MKALERQIEESVLIEKIVEVRAECLNLKSEWASSKIPGLSVSDPNGLLNQSKGEVEESEGVKAFKEAVRRGCKRLAYQAAAPGPEVSEEEEQVM